jgi:hypothetical protein
LSNSKIAKNELARIMEEAVWLFLILLILVAVTLFLTFLLDKKITSRENEVVEDKDNNNCSKQAMIDDVVWKCACEGGGLFLPPNLLRSVGGPSAFMRAGVGNCYHKQM